MMLCMAMLVGSSFAWFTDSVTFGKNKIIAGNLDVELEYAVEFDADGNPTKWDRVQDATNLFKQDTRWEPGHAEIVYLRLSNAGTLALKYKFGMNIVAETEPTNVNGDKFKLSQYLQYGVVEGQATAFADRDAAIAAVQNPAALADYSKEAVILAGAEPEYLALVVYMPTTVGNEANYRGNVIPTIDLGLSLVATQTPYEEDSFDEYYDADAPALTYEVTPETIGDYLSGKLGSLSNTRLILAPGDYGKLEIGMLTADSKDDTVYSCPDGAGHSGTELTFTDMDEFKAHFKAGEWHGRSSYTRKIENLTIAAEDGVTIEGLLITSGHRYDISDPINTGNAGYYLTHKLSNISFVNINFTGKVNINTSHPDTVIDGVTFENCSFTTGGTESTNGQALRYYNEANNGKVKNLTVKNCSFNNCYQGIYTAHIQGITIIGCTFNTTGHNAIAVQSGSTAVDHKAVVIENNSFNNIKDRIIRFGVVGADTQISIKNNTAASSGDGAGEVIKAQSLADGITYDISGNSWGEGTTVANPEFADRATGV